MEKAIVVGGSNGIGLAITNTLLEKGFFVHIFDIQVPNEKDLFDSTSYCYHYIDLKEIDHYDFEAFVSDESVKILMITAGFGRVAHFSNLSSVEIRDLIQVNTLASLEIIHQFYQRILSDSDFYTGVMVSIAGRLSSPLFSVYAASKAALSRFIESVNVELEMTGTSNRILEISPGSIKGTKFGGGDNNLELTKTLSDVIVSALLEKKDLLIPEYEEIFKGVLERYQQDPRKFGRDSYTYKVASGRMDTSIRKKSVGYLSGTFDLFHVGHLNLLRRAKEQCDYLIVGVHPDASHKGKETFISFEERLEIIKSNRFVDKAVTSFREDSDAWEKYHYDKLFVGSDYKGTERFKVYEAYFKDKGVEIVYFPYTQGTSSTQLREALSKPKKDEGGKI